MNTKLSGWDDTIVALATPPGIGALGIIRLSGKGAIEIVNQLFPSKDLAMEASHTLHVGFLKNDERVLDEVVVSLYKAPRSYTGENIAEITCHGSPFIHQQIIEACIEQGARLAKPGEFTQRAFLNGKLDLTQAEAVADLIASNTAASHKTALTNIRGGFSQTLKMLREQLLTFSALIELELDFSGEDVEFADRIQLKNLISKARQQTEELLRSFKFGNVIKNGVNTAIIGKPNAGKSTLLNVLVNEERAIVSEMPGTTRDTIEEVMNIDGILFRLIDTAGIRGGAVDEIEKVGIERSLQKRRNADIVIYLFDVEEMQLPELKLIIAEMKGFNFLLVGNKVDVIGEQAARKKFSTTGEIIFISAKENSHVEEVKEKMVNVVLQDNLQTENIIVTNARHYQALQEVNRSLIDIEEGMKNKLTSDLLALDIRSACNILAR